MEWRPRPPSRREKKGLVLVGLASWLSPNAYVLVSAVPDGSTLKAAPTRIRTWVSSVSL